MPGQPASEPTQTSTIGIAVLLPLTHSQPRVPAGQWTVPSGFTVGLGPAGLRTNPVVFTLALIGAQATDGAGHHTFTYGATVTVPAVLTTLLVPNATQSFWIVPPTVTWRQSVNGSTDAAPGAVTSRFR